MGQIRRRSIALLAAAVAAVGAVPRDARADDDIGDLTGLLAESVVSGASKTAEVSADAPASITTITGSELRIYGIRTLDEAIQYLAGGITVERNNLGYANYGSRGVILPVDFTNHILLVIDGHPVNESSFGSSYIDRTTGLPMEAIDHIEVIVGPGSVLYGTNAMMGTINVVTKSARALKGLGIQIEASGAPIQQRGGALGGDFQAWGRQYQANATFGHTFTLGGERAELTLFAQVLDDKLPNFFQGPQYDPQDPTNSGIHMGPNPPLPPIGGVPAENIWGGPYQNHRLLSGALYGRFVWNKLEVSARFTRDRHWQNEESPGRSVYNQPDGGGNEGFAHLDVAYRADVSQRLSLRPHVYADQYLFTDTNRYYDPTICLTADGLATPLPCTQATPSESYRFGAELTGSLDWLADGRFTTLAGVDLRFVNVYGKTDTLVDSLGQQAGTVGIFKASMQPTVALYVQQIARVTDWLRLNVGLRYDYFASLPGLSQTEAAAPKSDAPQIDHASPRVAAILTPWEGGTLKLIYSEGFRAPTPYEFGFSIPGAQLAAPRLTGEVVRSAEGILEQRVRTHHVSLSVFSTFWRNMIKQATIATGPNAGLIQNANSNSIDAVGVSSSYQGSSGPLSYGANATVTLATSPTDPTLVTPQATIWYAKNQPVPAAPRLSGNVHAAYDLGEGLPTLGLAASLLGPRLASTATVDQNLAALSTITSVSTQVSARLTASGAMPSVRGLRYRVGAELVAPTEAPFVVGSSAVYRDANGVPHADLQQVPRLTLMAGLAYTLF